MKNSKFAIILMLLCAVNSLTAQFANFNKKAPVPPIYGVLDFLATHPISECAEKEQELKNIISAPNFDVNLRYNEYYPPLAYLVRKNHDYLGHFSKEYISNNVLKMLIEKGARINTYDREGNSLLAFALETNNEYISQWFIDNGIDLGKTNKNNENIISKCIAEQNLSILQQITATADGKKMLNVDYLNQAIAVGSFEIVKHLHEKGVDINVNTLTVVPSNFIKNTVIYDYITKICADNAIEYADLRKHKSLFPDKFSLIKSKIDKIYYDEAKPVENAFEMIKQFVKTNAPIENNMFVGTKMSESELAIERRAAYAQQFAQKHNGYDPDNKIKIANNVIDFNMVMMGLNIQIWNTYLDYIDKKKFSLQDEWKDFFGDGLLHYKTYEIFEKDATTHHQQILNAIDMAKKIQNNNTFGNTSWFNEKIDELHKKEKKLQDTWERDKATYNADIERAKAQQAADHAKWEAERKAERAIQEFKEKCLDCEMDKEKTKLPTEKKDFLGFTSEKPGKFVTKNGFVEYFYYDGANGFKVNGWIFDDNYDNWTDMYEEFYKQCLRKKCPSYKE